MSHKLGYYHSREYTGGCGTYTILQNASVKSRWCEGYKLDDVLAPLYNVRYYTVGSRKILTV